MAEEKQEGELAFDETVGKFWIVREEIGIKPLNFGDKFEVKVGDNWVETNLEIGSGPEGDLIFILKNTPYQGVLDGIDARA